MKEVAVAGRKLQHFHIAALLEWLEDQPGLDQVLEYEARVNHLCNRLRQPAICFYELNRFSGATVLDVLRTHPYTIVEGVLRENPFYLPPEELFGGSSVRNPS